jgi:hypothetical protein
MPTAANENLNQMSIMGENTNISIPHQPSEESSKLLKDAFDKLLVKKELLVRN